MDIYDIYKMAQNYKISFGIEVEFTGITKPMACVAINDIVDGTHMVKGKRAWIRDSGGRDWKVVYDNSISKSIKINDNVLDYIECRNKILTKEDIMFLLELVDESNIEFVTPICEVDDIKKIKDIIDSLSTFGATTNKTCGVHIHISSPYLRSKSIKVMANNVSLLENDIFKVIEPYECRQNYCQRINKDFLDAINNLDYRKTSKHTIITEWKKHSKTKYYGLNIGSLKDKGTIEFRYFNSTLRRDNIDFYLWLSLGIFLSGLIRVELKKETSIDDFLTVL